MIRRKGKCERARVKKRREHIRCELYYVGRAGTYHIKAGRAKFSKVSNYLKNIFGNNHLEGESRILKSGTVTRRRLYTVTVADNNKS